MTVPTTLTFRFVFGTLAFYFLLALNHLRERQVRGPVRKVASNETSFFLKGRYLALAFGLGALGYTTMSGLFFWSVTFIPVGVAVVVLYTYPMLVVALSAFILREKITRYMTIALVLAFSGVILIAGFDVTSASLKGVMMVLIAAIVYSAYIIICRAVLARVNAQVLTAYVLPSAAIAFLLYGLASNQLSIPKFPDGWILVGGLAVLGTAIPVFAFFGGLSRIGASRASILSTFEPVVTVLLGITFLGEQVTLATFLGGLCVLLGGIIVHKR
jgi:drug/metabolite transporter (DMT)-like permease